MPIEADRFEDIDEDEDETPGTNAHEILSFLRDNHELAFTQKEIAEATGVKTGSVGPTLVRLRERGRVEHKGKYWRVSEHDRAVGDATSLSASVAESYEDDEFDRDEWLEHAVDPRKERET